MYKASSTVKPIRLMKKKKKNKWRFHRFPCITVSEYFSYFGSVIHIVRNVRYFLIFPGQAQSKIASMGIKLMVCVG